MFLADIGLALVLIIVLGVAIVMKMWGCVIVNHSGQGSTVKCRYVLTSAMVMVSVLVEHVSVMMDTLVSQYLS